MLYTVVIIHVRLFNKFGMRFFIFASAFDGPQVGVPQFHVSTDNPNLKLPSTIYSTVPLHTRVDGKGA
jgi:hypothetical protein